VHVGPEALTADGRTAPESTDVSAETPVGHPADPRRCHVEDGPAISPATAQAIACCATVSSMLHDHKGDPLDVGRRHRTPPPALRRAVRDRDRYRCQYPGCDSRKVQIHHIRHWSKGGKTKLRNLILLCRAHHAIIHDLNYGITAAADGFVFTTGDGKEINPSPPFPDNDGADIRTCHDARISPDTIIPAWYGDRLDLDHAIWACFANAKVIGAVAANGT